jgi:hypothetical protein
MPNTREMPAINKNINLPQALFFAAMAILYCYIGYTSFGYDDEFFNIRIVRENSFRDMVGIVQSTDIHPPLSYILNYFFFKVFNSWNSVRLVSAILFLFSFGYVVLKTKGHRMKWLVLLLLGLNPTILLWGTSLRWYAYATPLILLLSVLPDYNNKLYWYRFFAIFLLIFYLGYIGFILFIPYFLFYWMNDHTAIKKKIMRLLVPATLFALAYAHQLYIFLTVHSKTRLGPVNQQVFDLKTSLISVVSADLSNQGVFPLSVWGLMSIAGMGMVLLSSLLYFRELNKEKHWFTFALSTLLFMAVGIAGKIRNLVLLEPSRNLLIASAVSGHKKKLAVIGLCFLLAANTAGVYHVVLHRQTTKNAWNIPLHETLETLKKMEDPLAEEVYFTHSPTFTYYLTEADKNVISFYSIGYFDSSRIKTSVAEIERDTAARKNFTFLLSYRGKSISVAHYDEMLAAMNGLKADSVVKRRLGPDRDHALKKRYFPDYPEYEVEIIKFYGVKNAFKALAEWEKAD